VKRVYVQADAPFRAAPGDIGQWFVRNNQGEMVPFTSFSQSEWMTTPTSLSRFLGYPSYELQGQGAPGVSSGDAMNRIEQLASQIQGISVAWGRAVLSGAAVFGSGADPLRGCPHRRLLVPRRFV
jgi:multidrug efflux pump